MNGEAWRPRRVALRWRWDGERGRHILACMPLTGYVHVLNPTAALVFAACDGTRTVDEIVGQLRARYREIPSASDVRRDVDALLHALVTCGVVEPDSG